MAEALTPALPGYFRSQLKSMGYVYEDSLVEANLAPQILALVPAETAVSYRVIPLDFEEEPKLLTLVTNSEETVKNAVFLSDALGYKIRLLMGSAGNVDDALAYYYQVSLEHLALVSSISNMDTADSPQKRLIDAMLMEAYKEGASDIHLQPTPMGMDVKFRINGHLVDRSSRYVIPTNEINAVTNILKSKGQASSANINMPSKGAWTFSAGDTIVYVRLSAIPVSTLGDELWQKTNLRLLPQRKEVKKLSSLGYSPDDLAAISDCLHKFSTGAFFLSGPVGSGKTTTLYAMIDEILTYLGEPQIVFTIDNPVEIHDSRFTQVEVRETGDQELRLTSEMILETALRQDPNIILYGEVRTKTDADVVTKAAETGHKVLSTVHAQNCVSTIMRLLNLGVSRASLLAETNFIMTQKLVSILCSYCSREHTLTEAEKRLLTASEVKRLEKGTLRETGEAEKVRQCNHCHGTGYITRLVVPEYLVFDTELRDLFLNPALASFSAITKVLQERKFISMWDRVLLAVERGRVSLSEAFRVIGK